MSYPSEHLKPENLTFQTNLLVMAYDLLTRSMKAALPFTASPW